MINYFFCIFVTLLLIATSVSAFEFPLPKAQKEFYSLMKATETKILELNISNLNAFLQNNAPYAPLDIVITKNVTNIEAETLKNLYLGAVAAICKINNIANIVDNFHSSNFHKQSKGVLIDHLENIISLKNEITKIDEINLLAQWYDDNNFRINNFFIINKAVYKLTPTEVMGFTSFAYSERVKVDLLFENIKIKQEQIETFLIKLKQNGILAYNKLSKDKCKFIYSGISDNEIGLLFIENVNIPNVSSYDIDNKQYTILEKIAKNIYFYVTN